LAEHKREEEFKVIDRRLFTADGELRKEAVDEERRETEAARKIEAGKPAATKPAAGATKVTETPTPLSPEALKPSRNFQMLVDFMARNAAAMLGGYADPRTGQPMLDLEGAREFIDLLDVLHEKTRGNLAAEDDKLLLDVIGSLKLSFLELSKAAAAAAMSEKAKTRP
jgi:hypothetical protein